MDYMPKADWKWKYDQQQGKLSVVEGDRFFPLVYQPNMLRLCESQILPFTIEDVTRYIDLFESSAMSHFEAALRSKIILHLLAVDIFHKPIMPKSWLFLNAVNQKTQHYEHGQIVELITFEAEQAAKYMVLEQEGNFCLCMLFDKSHLFPNNKIFKQFQLIKVSADKLNFCKEAQKQTHEWVSFQNAG